MVTTTKRKTSKRALTPFNWVYNLLGNNFGYHTAHHLSPKAHWTRLPIIHENIKSMIPKELKKSYSWSGFMLPYHFLLALKKKM